MKLSKMLARRFKQIFNRITSFQKCLSTAENVNTENESPVSNKVKKKNISLSTEIGNYLKDAELEYFLNNISKKILRRQSKSNFTLYLFNQNTAKEISYMISEDLVNNSSFVIECNPGLGLLTKELLEMKVPSINLYEKNESFLLQNSPLEKLIMQHKKRLNFKQLNFFNVWMTLLHDKHNNDNIADIYLSDMPYHTWEQEPFAQIIAFCSNKFFLSMLIYNFVNQTNLYDHGRPTFFLAMSSVIWERAKADHNDPKLLRFYNQNNVILHLFFEFKCLGKLPRKSFVPWPTVKTSSKINALEIPIELIKLEPKSNTFPLLDNKNEFLIAFWYFLKHCMRSKKIKVIQEMEKWVPGCGPRLIELDLDICTIFKELSPDRLFELFKNFRTWSEYDENFFRPPEVSDEIKKDDEEKLETEEEQDIAPVSENLKNVAGDAVYQNENQEDGTTKNV